MTVQFQLTLSTRGHGDMHDITGEIHRGVASSGIRTGIAHIHVVGSTAAVGTIEYEPGLKRDLPEIMDRLMPPGRHYGHEQTWHDGNAHSHLQATTLGASITLPIADGSPILGTWQQVFLLECDVRPRQRTIVVTAQGDSD